MRSSSTPPRNGPPRRPIPTTSQPGTSGSRDRSSLLDELAVFPGVDVAPVLRTAVVAVEAVAVTYELEPLRSVRRRHEPKPRAAVPGEVIVAVVRPPDPSAS